MTVETLPSFKRIFLVDDHPIVREGLAAQLGDHAELCLCGEASDIADALLKIPETNPDLVIIDISLRSGNGIDLVKRLRVRMPTVRILVWSMHSEAIYAERALRAGANGYVEKARDVNHILNAIMSVLAGKTFVSDILAAKLLDKSIGKENRVMAPSIVEIMTDRELEAFGYLGQGMTTQQIAVKMHVSPKTVETYRARIKEKLGLRNATELIHSAVQWVMGQCSEAPAQNGDGVLTKSESADERKQT